MNTYNKLIFEQGDGTKTAVEFPKIEKDFKAYSDIASNLLRQEKAALPGVSEPELIRHFTRLSTLNYSVDTNFYPLGSCTMKYNPKINEDLSSLPGFENLHPYFGSEFAQGTLKIMYELSLFLCELSGMDNFSLQPAAGAHGELTGMMIVKFYHKQRGEEYRNKVIVPDSSHGTNPSSAAFYGFDVVEIKSGENGRVSLAALKEVVDKNCACLMLTNPNTLGLFEDEILEIADFVHSKGALLYYDGANMNALMGLCRPGDMGFDIVHLNLHKTFSTPHGGGGPGAGPVGVKEYLKDFLPVPVVAKKGDKYELQYDLKNSIGSVKSFYGNIAVLIKAYCYIRYMGKEGLKQATKDAILNANYMKKKIEKFLKVPYVDFCMHEFVASCEEYKNKHLHAVDFAKRLLDYGFYAPTVSFPLIVPDALMIEPTETENKETIDAFIEALEKVVKEAEKNSESLLNAPHTLPIKRCDEVRAARCPNLSFIN